MIFKECHLKLYIQYPEHLQTLILKDCVLLSRLNWKTGDFKSMKRFAMQDCVVNFPALLFKPFSDNLEEFTMLDSEPRNPPNYDPLD